MVDGYVPPVALVAMGVGTDLSEVVRVETALKSRVECESDEELSCNDARE